jgi:hypothetical protein
MQQLSNDLLSPFDHGPQDLIHNLARGVCPVVQIERSFKVGVLFCRLTIILL